MSGRTNTPKCARLQFLSATLLIVQMIMKKVTTMPSLFLLRIEPRFLGRRPSLCRMSCPSSHSSSNNVILINYFKIGVKCIRRAKIHKSVYRSLVLQSTGGTDTTLPHFHFALSCFPHALWDRYCICINQQFSHKSLCQKKKAACKCDIT